MGSAPVPTPFVPRRIEAEWPKSASKHPFETLGHAASLLRANGEREQPSPAKAPLNQVEKIGVVSSREGGNLLRQAHRLPPETPACAGEHEPETLHPARTPGYSDGRPENASSSLPPVRPEEPEAEGRGRLEGPSESRETRTAPIEKSLSRVAPGPGT
jgi:hypothetical protein